MEIDVGSNLESRSGMSVRRFVSMVRRDGIRATLRRAAEDALRAVRRDDFLVLRLRLEDTTQIPSERATEDLSGHTQVRREAVTADIQFGELTGEDDPYLDALPTVDGWTTMRDARIGWLRKGARCFLAKNEGLVIGSTWYTTQDAYYEPHLKRQLQLSPDESYGWGNYCLAEWRGQGVMPRLTSHAMGRLTTENGKRVILGMVRSSNQPSLRALQRNGSEQIGRIGFIEAFGFRLHYILGREAFKHTTRRLLLQRAR